MAGLRHGGVERPRIGKTESRAEPTQDTGKARGCLSGDPLPGGWGLDRGYGPADVEHGIPNAEDPRFMIAAYRERYPGFDALDPVEVLPLAAPKPVLVVAT
jgi:hypothetical protein